MNSTQLTKSREKLNGNGSHSEELLSRYYLVRSPKKIRLYDFKRKVETNALQKRRFEATLANLENDSHTSSEVDLKGFEVKDMSAEKVPAHKKSFLRNKDQGIHYIVQGTKADFASMEGDLINHGLEIDLVRDCDGKSLDDFKIQDQRKSLLRRLSLNKITDPYYIGQKAIAVLIVALTATLISGLYPIVRKPFNHSQTKIETKDNREIIGATYAFTTKETEYDVAKGIENSLTNYLSKNYSDLNYSINAPTWMNYGPKGCVQGVISGNISDMKEIQTFMEKESFIKLKVGALTPIHRNVKTPRATK